MVTVLRSFMSVERTRALLGGRREGVGNVAAAGLGVVTPFCSCSAVPAFIGFIAAGVPLGVTMSFLIATPMVNEVAIVMLYGLFGWRITAIYIATGLVIYATAGWVIGRMGMERWVKAVRVRDEAARQGDRPVDGSVLERPPRHGTRGGCHDDPAQDLAVPAGGYRSGRDHSLAGSWSNGLPIMLWVPWGCRSRWLSGCAALLGRGGCHAAGRALHDKGMPMGTVLAFMMSVVALSLPEMILLQVLQPRLIATFIAVVASGLIVTGYLFNVII